MRAPGFYQSPGPHTRTALPRVARTIEVGGSRMMLRLVRTQNSQRRKPWGRKVTGCIVASCRRMVLVPSSPCTEPKLTPELHDSEHKAVEEVAAP